MWWGKRLWRKITFVQPPSLPEMRAMADKYRGMSKARFMLRKGWPTLVGVAIFLVLDTIPGFEPWWARPFILLYMILNGWLFFRWEASWERWQHMRLPNDEQAEEMLTAMQQQADSEIDPFLRQMGNEAVLEIRRWINGEHQDDDR